MGIVASLVGVLRDFPLGSIVSIPHKEWEPAEERGSVLGNTDFHQGLGPHTCQGGAQCKEHHFYE